MSLTKAKKKLEKIIDERIGFTKSITGKMSPGERKARYGSTTGGPRMPKRKTPRPKPITVPRAPKPVPMPKVKPRKNGGPKPVPMPKLQPRKTGPKPVPMPKGKPRKTGPVARRKPGQPGRGMVQDYLDSRKNRKAGKRAK